MLARRYLIVGDGAAGITAAQTLRQRDPVSHITMVCDDPHPTYYRAALTNYLLGELADHQVWAVPPTFFERYRVERKLARVVTVDTARGQLWLASGGQPLSYDALLLGCGARARPAPFEGAQLAGVATMRTLQDVRTMMDMVESRQLHQAVIIGGGPLAIEWAVALRERNVAATLMVREQRLMTAALDEVASDLVVARLRQSGVDVRLGDEVHSAMPDAHGRVAGVQTKGGHRLPCQLVGAAIGVIPNTEFLANSDIALGQRGGVRVNAQMCTNVANVYAAGDVAEPDGAPLQLWEPAQRQALAAATNMTGGSASYHPGTFYFATRLGDLDFASVGRVRAEPGDDQHVDQPLQTGSISYRKVLLQGGKLVGALMLGQRKERVRQRGRQYKKLIDRGVDVSSVRDSLLDPAFDLAGWLHSRELMQKPRATSFVPAVPASQPQAAPAPANNAAIRGTQMISLGDMQAMQAAAPATAPSARQAGTVAIAEASAAPPGPKLSIGFRAAQAAEQAATQAAGFIDVGGHRHAIDRDLLSIGRGEGCHIVLPDPAVSHLHAQISRHPEGLFLRDLGSSRGTWVNGEPVTVPHKLRHGDQIQLGQMTLLFSSLDGVAPSSAVAAPEPSVAGGKLVVRSGHALGLSFALQGTELSVGRDPSNQIRLDDIAVSRRHAVLHQHQGRWYITDMHSRRGTLRNGGALPPGHQQMLEPGDQLQLGDTVVQFLVGGARA
jgi:nitrite reductase (NADH) large subunit